MNNIRRERIDKIILNLDRVRQLIDIYINEISEIIAEEQESFDNLSEGFQFSEKGEKMENSIEALDSAINKLSDLDFDSAIDNLEDAKI